MTLLLIVLNTLIYFAYQGDDSAREKHAVKTYLDAGLLSLSLLLGKLLGQRQERHSLSEVSAVMRQHFADAEQTRQLSFYRQNRID